MRRFRGGTAILVGGAIAGAPDISDAVGFSDLRGVPVALATRHAPSHPAA